MNLLCVYKNTCQSKIHQLFLPHLCSRVFANIPKSPPKNVCFDTESFSTHTGKQTKNRHMKSIKKTGVIVLCKLKKQHC